MAEAATSPRPGTPRSTVPSSPAVSVKKSPASAKKSSPVEASPRLAATPPAVSVKPSPLLQAAASPLVAAAASPAAAAKSPRSAPPQSPRAAVPGSPAAAAAAPPAAEGEAEGTKKKLLKKKKNAVQAEGGAPLPSASASREDNLQYDLKRMSAYDIAVQSAKTSEADFLAYTRDSVQLLVNKMFGLKRARVEEGMVVELPADELFKLPRQKPVPKVKARTRFQKFMEDRNMKKRKRSRLVFDEVSGDWKPRYGYGSAKKMEEAGKYGIHEVKSGEDPNSNPFERMQAEQKLQQLRQKMREVRNKVEQAGGKMRAAVPDLLQGGAKRGKDGLKEAMRRSQISSGSRGKFDRIAPGEATNLQQKRSIIHQPMSGDKEKERYNKFVGKVLAGETVDKDKAAKAGRQAAQGTKVAKKQKAKGNKGTPGSGRRSKQGGRDKTTKGGAKKSKFGGGGGKKKGKGGKK